MTDTVIIDLTTAAQRRLEQAKHLAKTMRRQSRGKLLSLAQSIELLRLDCCVQMAQDDVNASS